MLRFAILILLAAAAQAGWIIDQSTRGDEKVRIVIGKSDWKETRGKRDLIADFADDMVFRIDHQAKTVAKITLKAYLEKQAAEQHHDAEKPNGPDRVGGVACLRFQSVYTPGDDRGAEGCVTNMFTVAAPYEEKLEAWLRATQAFGDRGLLVWMRAQTGGPWHVTLWTTHAVEREISREEFFPPPKYQEVPFTFE